MIPLRDDQPTFSTPFVNYFLIVLNLLVFVWELSVSHRALSLFMLEFGVVPHHTLAVLTGHSPAPVASAILPLFTSMFLHASFLHVAGNMLFLWIFGDNVEDHRTLRVSGVLPGQRSGCGRDSYSDEPGVSRAQCGGERRDCWSDGRVFYFVSAGAGADLVSSDIFVSRSGLADAWLLVRGKFLERNCHSDRRDQPDFGRDCLLGACRRVRCGGGVG